MDIAKGVTYTTKKYVRYSTGEIINDLNGGKEATDYIDVSAYEALVYTRVSTTSTSAVQYGMAFYDSEKEYISGQRALYNQSEYKYYLATVSVPEGAVYARFTAQRAFGDVKVYDAADYQSKLEYRIEAAENNISEIQRQRAVEADKLNSILTNGYFKLPTDEFESGGWDSYTNADNRAYRVRHKTALQFDHDIYILADVGYRIGGHRSDGTSISPNTTLKIPANTNFKLYIRRLNEDYSEVADIETFAKAVRFSTALAPIELYAPTFTDVSMFERMGISGDSYSAGGGIISGITALTWGKNLQRQSGVQVDIYAKSGDSIVDWVQNQTKGLPALLAGTECGLYWFQHGINGTSSAAAIGTAEDMSADPKPNTFYGQYAYAIEAVKTAFPNARIVIATVLGSDWTLAQINYAAANTAIKAIAEYEEIPCIDISEDEFFRSKFYELYGASNHPTAMQAAGMAMAYRRLISKCIQANPNYFKNYGA